MAMNLLHRLGRAAPAPVYAALGTGGADRAGPLSGRPGLRLVPSIRHAAILLVAGAIRDGDRQHLRQLHDQMPHPRKTVWWGARPFHEMTDPVIVEPQDDPAACIAGLWRGLLSGELASEAGLLPDKPAHQWRGRGDHGQGGEGMMGGTPYGRPMAMPEDDLRDGLALDSFTCAFGPFLAILPPGMQLEITLQGDVIQSAKVRRPPYAPATIDSSASLRKALMQLMGGAKMGARHALPPDLGHICGTSLRDRFDGQVPGPAKGALPRLADLLPGLEWNEAILLINSIPHSLLQQMCPVDEDTDHAGGSGKRGAHAQGQSKRGDGG